MPVGGTNLHTFSIGFKDESFFDETDYATLVAKHFVRLAPFFLCQTMTYTGISMLFSTIYMNPLLTHQPIVVYILRSKETSKHYTAALFGDGADELLGGYNKHEAILRMFRPGFKETIVANLGGLWKVLPQSRHNPVFQ